MDDLTIQIMVGAVIAIQLLQSVMGINLRQMARQINDLHDWHDKEDDDGVKVWYVRHSFEEAVVKIGDGIAKQNDVFVSFRDMLKEQHTMLMNLEKLIEIRLQQETKS